MKDDKEEGEISKSNEWFGSDVAETWRFWMGSILVVFERVVGNFWVTALLGSIIVALD